MLFDDRLATVLRSVVGGEQAARTQYRQLLDLLGSVRAPEAGLSIESYRRMAQLAEGMTAADVDRQLLRPALETRNHLLLTFLAYHRLAALGGHIPAEERSRILREPGLRLRNRRLVAFLAGGDPKTAAGAVATARLSEADWLTLIPQMPVMARGFLRHRRDLPPSARDLLGKLGVHDHVLPEPEQPMAIPLHQADEPTAQPLEKAPPADAAEDKHDGIRALLRRIEAFREERGKESSHPRLPLGDRVEDDAANRLDDIAFTADADGRIDWAEPHIAPYFVGMRFGPKGPATIAALSAPAARALQQRQLLRAEKVEIDAAPVISGEWRLDAAPVFDPASHHFKGFTGRLRRPVLMPAEPGQQDADTPEDRMRQVLHELRTPVNAIQGFAEIIQQQLFGMAPNEYRALAAGVAVDAAKLLAAFDEVDRLTRLETQSQELEEGSADLREAVSDTITRLDGVLRARNSGLELTVTGGPFTTDLAREELLGTCWRLLASIGGSLAPAERTEVILASDGQEARLTCQLPLSLIESDDIFTAPVPQNRPALSAGMFGTGFSFRLARAEILAAGGEFTVQDECLTILLPVLTEDKPIHSKVDGTATRHKA